MANYHEEVSTPQHLTLSFQVPNREACTVDITCQPCDDPKKYGNHIILPHIDLSKFLDYPVTYARVHSPHSRGYASYYGWIQVYRETPKLGKADDAPWKIDVYPAHGDLNTPFLALGPEPQVFDQPSRTDHHPPKDVDWDARTYLCYLDDGLLTKKVRPVLAFQWGFWIDDGKIKVKKVEEVDIEKAWEECKGLFEETYSGWNFLDKE